MPEDHERRGLDPDDPRPPSQQIARLLAAAIRTGRLQPGERLPSQNDLARRYGVARETVKGALRILRDERLVVTRQGSGAFVRAHTERPVGLRPHIEAAFARPNVSIDFAGFSGKTLHGALQEPLDKIRAGRLSPESLAVRILLPDLDGPSAVPSRADAAADDSAVRERAARIARRHTEAIVDSVQELADLGLVHTASAQVRTHMGTSLFKLYLLNRIDAFFGFYPIIEHPVNVDSEPVAIYDVLGKDPVLFHFAVATNDDMATQYVEQAQAWFDSVWTTIARERTP